MLINSVNGPVDTADLGVTLIHEHVVNLEFSLLLAYPDIWFDREECLKIYNNEVGKAKKHGLKTYVDATPINLGRDVNLIKEAADKAGVIGLFATGLYYPEDPWFILGIEEDYAAELFVRDLTKGCQGTDMKAAFIKVGTDPNVGLTDINLSILKAAAIAHKETGAPVYTHSSPVNKIGLKQQEVLLKEGVAPEKLVIGHSFDTTDLDYVESLIKNGSYVGCDRIGLRITVAPKELGDFVAKLIERGHSKKIMISHDGVIFNDYGVSMHRDKRNHATCKVVGGYGPVFEIFHPRLRELGVTEDVIQDMMIGNPRRYFEGQPLK
jgi:phosphotriesterase-related protein